MQKLREELIIVGIGEIAEMAYEYFTLDSIYNVIAFSAEKSYTDNTQLLGLPIVRLENIESKFSPDRYKLFIALGYDKLNRSRMQFYQECKAKGYELVSYISSKAYIGNDVEIGDNCFILEGNVLQRKVKIGNDVTLWSGNHIGHRSAIGDHCFLSSHIAISGYCSIGQSCFLGINSCVADHISIEEDCVISAGAVILNDTENGKIYRGNPGIAAKIDSYKVFGIKPRLEMTI
ncbi:acetyltransferase [Sporomusa acidovorans]|uniref:UDP-3-O-(3-hydroxymyristoyl)glucosamine N-acyltransferase n=1 Tax=Sporomusa acidovorans (strain ATCC 49682 / DSM 3132 / Mol) TaxID=1123286 RepID=A0ABZ3J9F3_SPOA4|nr:acetyltransferase [Sporomusa acidovorans]OZC15137.1 UDP-N-acetylbacillosamine N-acetyltransferase [Sporomusa acidovorans DSM 3132]SDF44122.1 sugar O-acyltransferase, sialic acid O-acetyltransferase NeuD family [Sporomusa acidovorans]